MFKWFIVRIMFESLYLTLHLQYIVVLVPISHAIKLSSTNADNGTVGCEFLTMLLWKP